MGEAVGRGNGWAYTRDGGTRDARAVGRRGRAARLAAQHTAARRRVRPGRASTVTSLVSASRADEKPSASTEQVRERRARVGGHSGRGSAEWCAGRWRGRGWVRRHRRGGGGGGGRQEGRTAAESEPVVGPQGRAARARAVDRCSAPVRDGAAPRSALAAARRVTLPRARTPLPYHAYIPLSGRTHPPRRPRVPEYYRLGIYLFGTRDARARLVTPAASDVGCENGPRGRRGAPTRRDATPRTRLVLIF